MIKKFNSFNENQSSYVTKEGESLVNHVKDSYPSLLRYYSMEMGEFSFTKSELEQQASAVFGWMEEKS